ncbi:MAG: ClpC ATPase [Chloroflexi bacterium]|jgi:excisionase family DNA binding protein|nr:ClpC ATPase [Chloroflexota bacterium]
MSDEVVEPSGPEESSNEQVVTDAPSQRAKALREEMLGSALSLDEVAYILSLDRTTVAKYLRENTISGFQIGREWLVPEESLRNYVRGVAESRRGPWDRSSPSAERSAAQHRGIIELVRDEFPWIGTRKGRSEPVVPGKNRFDKFTKRAQTVLTLAQDEARRLNHNYIGTEHLLLGMVREGEGVASKVLTNLGVDLNQVRNGVESIIGRGDRTVVGQVGLTPRAKKVMELAVDEALRLGHPYIGTEHLLLGLLREGEGIAANILESLGVQLETARNETMRVLEDTASRGGAKGQQDAPPVPPEASSLLPADQQGITCSVCGARSPAYFRYCFNCGAELSGKA